MRTKDLIENYYKAFASRDMTSVKKILDTSFEHRSKEAIITSAQEFIDKCWEYGEGLTDVKFKEEVIAVNKAFYILEWIGENGSFHDAEYIEVKNDKITRILVINNEPDFYTQLM